MKEEIKPDEKILIKETKYNKGYGNAILFFIFLLFNLVGLILIAKKLNIDLFADDLASKLIATVIWIDFTAFCICVAFLVLGRTSYWKEGTMKDLETKKKEKKDEKD